MKTSTKVLTSLLLITAVGVGIAGAQSIPSTATTNASATVSANKELRIENRDKLKNLSADVKAQLETARKNKDFAQVKSILTANGINLPKVDKRLDRKQNRQDRKADRTKIKALSADVKAELKTARQAGDYAKVQSILTANGITVPANFVQNQQRRAAIKALPADVTAQLQTARKNKDSAAVKSILEAHGITPAVQSSTSAQ